MGLRLDGGDYGRNRPGDPIYGGIRHARLAGQGLVWPCPTADHPGTPILHADLYAWPREVPCGRGPRTSRGNPTPTFPLILTTGRILYHYHTGTMTRRGEGLTWRESRGYAEIHEQDAAAARIRDGGSVLITSRRGQVRTQARVGQRVPPGTVFLSFHWKEAPASLLTQDFALDPLAKIPEYKVCAGASGTSPVGGARQGAAPRSASLGGCRQPERWGKQGASAG